MIEDEDRTVEEQKVKDALKMCRYPERSFKKVKDQVSGAKSKKVNKNINRLVINKGSEKEKLFFLMCKVSQKESPGYSSHITLTQL